MSNYFYGWYFRFQGKYGTAAVIPAVHLSAEKRCCSVQVITPLESLYREFPISELKINTKKGIMQIGENLFSQKGIRLNLEEEKQTAVRGCLRFGTYTKPRYDIMGPFAYIPGMECRHAVYSMWHRVDGTLTLKDKKIVFENGSGYTEGDSGTSFPDQYIWTQSFFPGGSLMLAAATVPVAGMRFTGTIGIVLLDNREYRFATYLGASVKKTGERELLIRQGAWRLWVRFSDSDGRTLKAPVRGNMSRKIRESVACETEYILTCKERVLLHVVADKAAAEYERPV